MKCGKYILILLIVIFIGSNRVFAEGSSHSSGRSGDDITYTCYYISNELAARIDIDYKNNGNKINMTAYFDRRSLNMMSRNQRQPVDNLGKDAIINLYGVFNVPGYYMTDTICPEYVIFYDSGENINGYYAYVAKDQQTALEMKKNLDKIAVLNGSQNVFYASNTNITEPKYWDTFMDVYSYNGSLLDGVEVCDLDKPGCEIEEVCGDLLGVEDDPSSLRYLLNKILGYVRVIVPILIILLGIFDLAKAVVAGKEDEMKKAQTTFFKRIIAGIIVFFVPVIVNVVMWLANMVWDYTTCQL